MDLKAGFADPPVDAARAFRLVLDAMSHPGRIVDLPAIEAPAPCSPAAATVLLTLVDSTTPLHLAVAHDTRALRDWARFHLGAELVDPAKAAFAYGTWRALGPLGQYMQGSADYPDRSATLIVETPALRNTGARLTGPGIADQAFLDLPDIGALQSNAALFPRGVDLIFTCGTRLAALPRSTKIGGA